MKAVARDSVLRAEASIGSAMNVFKFRILELAEKAFLVEFCQIQVLLVKGVVLGKGADGGRQQPKTVGFRRIDLRLFRDVDGQGDGVPVLDDGVGAVGGDLPVLAGFREEAEPFFDRACVLRAAIATFPA